MAWLPDSRRGRPVGSWLAPESAPVPFGDDLVARERFLSWQQLGPEVANGLIKPASHTYDLRRGITGNPQGNSEPAVTTGLYRNEGSDECETANRLQLPADLDLRPLSVSALQFTVTSGWIVPTTGA